MRDGVTKSVAKSLKINMPLIADIVTLLIWNPREREACCEGLVPIALVSPINHQSETVRMNYHLLPSVDVDDLLGTRADLPISNMRLEGSRVSPKLFSSLGWRLDCFVPHQKMRARRLLRQNRYLIRIKGRF